MVRGGKQHVGAQKWTLLVQSLETEEAGRGGLGTALQAALRI